MHHTTRRLAPLLLAALLALPAHAAQPAAVTPAPEPAVAPALSLDQALKNFTVAPVSAPTLGAGAGMDEAESGQALRSASGAFTEWRNTQSQLSNLQSYFDNNNYADALRQARQYARQATTPEVRQRWTDLITALEAEQKKTEAAVSEKITATLARATETILAARKPSDLDPVLEHLAALQENNRGSSSPRLQRLYGRLSNASSFVQQWQDMLTTYAEGDLDTTRQTLRNLSSNNSRDRLLTRSQIHGVTAALKLDQGTVESAFARIDPILKEVSDLALTAKTAVALDPAIARLEELKEDYQNTYNTPLRRAQDRLENAINFFRQWQDFLAAYEQGDERDARQQLRNLASNSTRYRPVPRAAMVDRATTLIDELDTETDALISDLSWENFATVRARVIEAQENAPYGRRATELARLVSELDRLATARADLKSGKAGLGRAALRSDPTTTGSCSGNTTQLPLPARVAALRDSWWFEAMHSLTGLSALPPRQGEESALDYAGRQLDAALAAADWPRAHRFALLQRDILPADATPCGEREKTTGANAAAALGAYLTAQKLERALQPEAAASAYREALAAGAPPALEEALIQRLRELAAPPPKTPGDK